MPNPSFIHLHLHTEYSIVDGLVGIKPLMKAVAAAGMPAIAMTDQVNLFAMVKFYRAAQAAGIKPIVGAEIWLVHSAEEKTPTRLVLLCQNDIGYKNLTRLLSRAYLEGQRLGVPLLEISWLSGHTDGLIALSGGRSGDIGQALLANQPALVNQYLQTWQALFPQRFYLELQRTGRPQEEEYIQMALNLAMDHDLPVVATNDVRFLRAEDFEAHEARVCIHGGFVLDDPRRSRDYSDQQYLRSPEEMAALFSDIPEALQNTVEIAKRCNLLLTLGKSFLPNFPVPNGLSVDEFFRDEAINGLQKRLATCTPTQSLDDYETRLQLEIDVIQTMGFTGYFLIVADFIRWAKQQHIFVGPGRGSGAGSLVAYALGITDLDPMQHDLLFERFLNPERVSMADFDIDFCMEGRDRVIEYVADKYGRDSVAQIITYGTMAARAVVRDAGRVLGYPYGFVDAIAKLIPMELGVTLKKALTDEPLLHQRYQQESEVKTLIDLAQKLEGVPRNVGKHAGGVVIAPSVLTDFTPLYCEPDGLHRITQFDKDDVEAVGLVKFDFLGLRTLTILDWTLQNINATHQQTDTATIDLHTLPLNDQATYELLKSCQTTAVFQLESRGIKELIKRLQPDRFDEIVALVALFRPGPLQSGMVDDFLDRKHGRAPVVYPHPALEPILKPTYGVILYQEQVMQIAQVLAGYTLGGADLLRRAMGKKKPEEMARQREIFVNGAHTNGVASDTANHIFDLMEKFADYGFNKSHSAAYALLSYQTAWLKAHYPAEFMAAVLSSDMDNVDKVAKYFADCLQLGLQIIAPDINRSQPRFTVIDNQILYGLAAIRGVGHTALDSIIENRQTDGPYPDLFAFCQRVDTRKVNRKVLEALIRSGAMDSFKVDRAILLASLDLALQTAEQNSRAKFLGQTDLFAKEVVSDRPPYVSAPPLSQELLLAGEKETLGWYLSGHPIAQYEAELAQIISFPLHQIKPSRDQVTVAGYITTLRHIQTKSGNRMAAITLEDRIGRVELMVFSPLYDSCRPLLVKDQLLIVEGEVSNDEFTGGYKLIARQLYDLTHIRQQRGGRLKLQLHHHKLNADFFTALQAALSPYCGGHCLVEVEYQHSLAQARFELGEAWRIKPEEDLLTSLTALCGADNVSLVY